MKWHTSRYLVVGFRAIENCRKRTAANFESGGQGFESLPARQPRNPVRFGEFSTEEMEARVDHGHGTAILRDRLQSRRSSPPQTCNAERQRYRMWAARRFLGLYDFLDVPAPGLLACLRRRVVKMDCRLLCARHRRVRSIREQHL